MPQQPNLEFSGTHTWAYGGYEDFLIVQPTMEEFAASLAFQVCQGYAMSETEIDCIEVVHRRQLTSDERALLTELLPKAVAHCKAEKEEKEKQEKHIAEVARKKAAHMKLEVTFSGIRDDLTPEAFDRWCRTIERSRQELAKLEQQA